MAKKKSFLVDVWFFSRAILRDRVTRRRFVAHLLIVVMTLLILGNWPLSAWVEQTKLRFVIWWGGTTFLTIWIFLLALYDAMRVRREMMAEDDPS